MPIRCENKIELKPEVFMGGILVHVDACVCVIRFVFRMLSRCHVRVCVCVCDDKVGD